MKKNGEKRKKPSIKKVLYSVAFILNEWGSRRIMRSGGAVLAPPY